MDNFKLEQMIEKMDKGNKVCTTLNEVVEVYNYLKELKMYREIGTLEEFCTTKELLEEHEIMVAQNLETNRRLIKMIEGKCDKEKAFYEFQQIVGMILEEAEADPGLQIGEFNIEKCFDEFIEKSGLGVCFPKELTNECR